MELTLGTWQIIVRRTGFSAPQLSQMYDTNAGRWHEKMRRLGYLQAYAELLDRLQKSGALGELPHPARVLDCGMGTAALSLGLAKTAGANLQLAGVDISARMLQRAQQVLDQVGLAVETHCQDAQRLNFDDNSFDLAMSAHMLEHMAQPQLAVQEMTRVLKPGGRLLLVVSKPGFCTACLRLRWNYTTYQPHQIIEMMLETGLSKIKLHTFAGGLPARTSLAYVGIK